MHTRRILSASVAGLALATVAIAGPKFTKTWHASEASGKSFAGKKVVALVIASDENLRISTEEALVRDLLAVGVTDAVAAYRVIPAPELKNADTARVWVERAGAAGVVAMRPIDVRKEITYEPSTWALPYYGTLWGYYGYGWGSVWDPGTVREDTKLVVETMVFGVAENKLLWAGVSETTNPKDAQKVVKDLVNATVKELQKEGLVRKN